ncbi:unnamed protein product [Arabidopsis thaliana]|uniref:(thale cress) hypothetical protein n=1 Tax=Arabidopsis thaliana TaxID=3702 RepID=A0A7G2EBM5_ARATH|nr:unnamed protein product [Arabidopsis thaliana]
MAAGGKGKSSRGRGRGRGRVRESSTGVQVFQGKNPVLGSSGHRASSHSSNPNSATQSHRSRPSQYPPATVPQTTPPQTTLTPTNSRQPLLSGSQQPPPVHRNLPPTRQRQAPTSQQQPPTCQQKAPSRQHQSLGLQQQPRQTEQQNPNNHEEEDGVEDWEEDGEEDGEEEEEEEEDPNSPEEDNHNVDYQDLLDSLLALPGLQQLPLLSEKPIPGVETLWFNRHKGKLSRVIAGIFRRKFDGPYFIWKPRSGCKGFSVKQRKVVHNHRGFRDKLWARMWEHWNTKDAIERSENASQCRNSTRGGLGVHKHVAGQKSFLQVHQEMVRFLFSSKRFT